MNEKIICSDIIKQRRKELGMTQVQLAEKLHVTNKAISKWETGDANPDISLLLPLSRALDISLDELLGNTENKNTTIVEEQLTVKTSDKIKYILCIVGSIPSVIISLLLLLSSIFAFDKNTVAKSTGNGDDQIFIIIFSSVLLLLFVALTSFLITKAVHLNTVLTVKKRIYLRKVAREMGCVLYSDLSRKEKTEFINAFNKKYIAVIICMILSCLLILISALTVDTIGFILHIIGFSGTTVCFVLINILRKKFLLHNKIYYR